jgi:cytochrome c553
MKWCVFVLAISAPLAARELTFSEDAAPVIFKHCAGCHHPNDLAPMSFLTYEQVKPWAAAIREAVLLKTMPPWKADPHYGRWANDWSLSEQEIATIVSWVDQGKKEGDKSKLPPQPAFSSGWRIGNPDLILSIPPHVLGASGPDEYESFTVPTNFTEDRWVLAAELRPGNRKVVHHAHVFVVEPSAAPKPQTTAAAKPDPQAEYAKWLSIREGKLAWRRPEAPVINDGCIVDDNGYLPGGKPVDAKFGTWGMLSSYLPGREPDVFPAGTARRIPAGANLSFQIHYSKATGKEETDETSVGLIFAKEPPRVVAKRVDLSNLMFRIPAGDPNVEVSECHTFQQDLYLTSLTPHMHLRGKDARFTVTYPNGEHETLLFVPHYNFNWQITYRMAEPKFIPKGTRLAIVSHFDNSANNPLNPDPTQTVRWGEASEMEMMDGWMEYVDRLPDNKSNP